MLTKLLCTLGFHLPHRLPRYAERTYVGGRSVKNASGPFEFVCLRPGCRWREIRFRKAEDPDVVMHRRGAA